MSGKWAENMWKMQRKMWWGHVCACWLQRACTTISPRGSSNVERIHHDLLENNCPAIYGRWRNMHTPTLPMRAPMLGPERQRTSKRRQRSGSFYCTGALELWVGILSTSRENLGGKCLAGSQLLEQVLDQILLCACVPACVTKLKKNVTTP